jgi:hypothetical protein
MDVKTSVPEWISGGRYLHGAAEGRVIPGKESLVRKAGEKLVWPEAESKVLGMSCWIPSWWWS